MPMGQHLAGMGDEMPQKLELLGRELDLVTGAGHLSAGAAPRKILSRPRPSCLAASSKASGDGRASLSGMREV
jgi:hypothetical protein